MFSQPSRPIFNPKISWRTMMRSPNNALLLLVLSFSPHPLLSPPSTHYKWMLKPIFYQNWSNVGTSFFSQIKKIIAKKTFTSVTARKKENTLFIQRWVIHIPSIEGTTWRRLLWSSTSWQYKTWFAKGSVYLKLTSGCVPFGPANFWNKVFWPYGTVNLEYVAMIFMTYSGSFMQKIWYGV